MEAYSLGGPFCQTEMRSAKVYLNWMTKNDWGVYNHLLIYY